MLCTVSAQAALITSTSSGIITSGDDALGLFGAPGSLAGSVFTQTIVFDSADGVVSTQTGEAKIDTAGPVTITVSVNGISFTRTLTLNTNATHRVRNFDFTPPAAEISSTLESDDGNLRVEATNLVQSSTHDFIGAVIDLNANYERYFDPTDMSFAAFQVSDLGLDRITFFISDRLDAVVLNPVNVPEPASLALVGLGLLAVARSRRVAAKR